MPAVPAAPEGRKLSPETVLAALPKPQRAVFLAFEDDGFLRLEHNAPEASSTERAEHLCDAEQTLTRAGYQVWPTGLRLEVSRKQIHEQNFSVAFAEECEGCGSPTPFGCLCRDTIPEIAEVA